MVRAPVVGSTETGKRTARAASATENPAVAEYPTGWEAPRQTIVAVS